jgi:hypothetical protein
VLLDSGKVTQSQTVIFDDAPHVPPPVLLPEVAAKQQLQSAGDMDGDSDSEDKVQVHTSVPPVPLVPPVAPFAGASDDGSVSADEVELHRYSAVPVVPPVATAGPSVAPPAGLTGSGVQAVGRPMRASRNPHPKYASAATREPEQGVGGIRGEPLSCLMVPKQRRASVRMAPSRQGSITPHGMADSAKTKTRAARAQAWRRMRREMVNPVRGREAAKAKGRWEAAGHGAVQCGRAQRCQKINGDMKAFAVAVASPDLHSHALPPRTIVEALSRPDAARWQAAIDEELASFREFGVWEECELPAGKQALPSRFVLERKRDGRYKARLVAGGHRQQYGLDFEDKFAPVCSYRTMRMILAVSAHENLVLRQFDVRTAFLKGELEQEVYVHPPPGAEHLAVGNKRVLRLRRALYGLKQAPRAWNKRVEGELRAKGFEQSDADPALWVLRGEGGAVLVMFYVDDGLVAAKTAAEADALVDLVGSMFDIRKLGEPQDFHGIHICRDCSAGTITVDQEDNAEALAAEVGVSGQCRMVPMSPEAYWELRGAQPGEPMTDKLRCQRVVCSLLHLA